jgi:hypothetical protein
MAHETTTQQYFVLINERVCKRLVAETLELVHHGCLFVDKNPMIEQVPIVQV